MNELKCPLPVVRPWTREDDDGYGDPTYRVEPCGETVRRYGLIMTDDVYDPAVIPVDGEDDPLMVRALRPSVYEREGDWELKCDMGHVILRADNEDRTTPLTPDLVVATLEYLARLRPEQMEDLWPSPRTSSTEPSAPPSTAG